MFRVSFKVLLYVLLVYLFLMFSCDFYGSVCSYLNYSLIFKFAIILIIGSNFVQSTYFLNMFEDSQFLRESMGNACWRHLYLLIRNS